MVVPGWAVGIRHTVITGRIIILVGCTFGDGTILPRKAWQAVADSSCAETILRAPIGTDLSTLSAEILKHRTLQVSIKCRDRLGYSLLIAQTNYTISANCKLNRAILGMAHIGVTPRTILLRHSHRAQSTLYTKRFGTVLLKCVLLVSIIICIRVHTMEVLAEQTTTICHQSCSVGADSLTQESSRTNRSIDVVSRVTEVLVIR